MGETQWEQAGATGGDYAARLERRWGRWPAAAAVAFTAQALSFFLYSFPFWIPLNDRLVETYAPLCADPWTHGVLSRPQARHRLLGPLVAHYLGLRNESGAAVPVAAVTAFLMLLYALLRREGLTPRAAARGTFLLATTLPVISSQTWLGFPDSLGHLGALACLYARRSWLLFPLMLLGMLGDERCAAAAPLILLWHFLRDEPSQRWWRGARRGLAMTAAAALWLAFFFYIHHAFVPPDVKPMADAADTPALIGNIFKGEYLKLTANTMPGAVFQALRAAWFFPILLLVTWLKGQRVGEAGLFLLALAAALAPGALGGDISRVCATAFPAVLLALVELYRQAPTRIGQLLSACLLLNVFTPQYQVVGNTYQLYWPLPLALLRWYVESGVG